MRDTFTKGEWNRLCGMLGDEGFPELEYLARGVDFVWDDSLTVENGILGKFVPSNKIYLPMWSKDSMREMLPTVAHELVHYRQYQRYGRWGYYFRNCPLWSKWLIEAEAEKVEMEVDLQMQKKMGLCLTPKEG